MKKISAIILSVVFVFCLAGCSQTESGTSSSMSDRTSSAPNTVNNSSTGADSSAEEDNTNTQNGTLIVYFSWSSNTEKIANLIKEQTGGDILELVPENAYPTDYTECTEVALEERDSNARPKIKDLPESISEYNKIIIGYPIWWHTAPMIIGTFLESYDLSGVDVYPFSQSASMDTEQFDNSMEFIRECADNANVHDGLFASSSDTETIAKYLTDNGLTK